MDYQMTEQHQWRHDRAHVRMLQQAHADHIESIYRGLAQQPGNPHGVRIQTFGRTRTFVAEGKRLENRAIFTGNEALDAFDAVLAYFDQQETTCFIEVNPANFYRTDPFSWESEVLPHLVHLGCRIEGFRCVWQCFTPPAAGNATDAHPIERFGPGQIDDYVALARRVETTRDWEKHGTELRGGESGAGWYHYIGYAGAEPCAVAGLFSNNGLGYLSWGYTHPDYRGRGYQSALIRRRVADAFTLDCHGAFTVSDFNIQSARNLQRCGFQLAYNYILLMYEPSAATTGAGDSGRGA